MAFRILAVLLVAMVGALQPAAAPTLVAVTRIWAAGAAALIFSSSTSNTSIPWGRSGTPS